MRTLHTKSLIAALALLAVLGAFSGAAWAKTIVVDPVTGDDSAATGCAHIPPLKPCATIAGAVAIAVPFDVIQLLPGLHVVAAAGLVVTVPNLTISGAGPGVTFIDGHLLGVPPLGTLDIEANNVTVQGFTITGTVASGAACSVNGTAIPFAFQAAIRVGASVAATPHPVTTGVIIRNTQITSNTGPAIVVCNSTTTQILSNQIVGNNTLNSAPDVEIHGSDLVLVQGNTIDAAGVSSTYGLSISGNATAAFQGKNNTVQNNTFRGHNPGLFSEVRFETNSNTNAITGNTFNLLGGTGGTSIRGVAFAVGTPTGNTIQANTFDGGNLKANDGIFFAVAATGTTITQNTFRNLLQDATPIGGSGIDFGAAAAGMATFVSNNLFNNNTNGITFSFAPAAGQNDQFTLNRIINNTFGVHVLVAPTAGANEVFTQNNFENNSTGWSFTTRAGVAVTNAATAFPAVNNWWNSTSGPNCPVLSACNAPGGGPRFTSGDTVQNTGGGPVPLITDFFSISPFQTAFGTSLNLPVSLAVSSIQAVGLGGLRPGLQVHVQGRGIAGIQLQVYDLGGHLVTDQSASGASLRWNGLSSLGRTLANGVYLYVVTVKGQDGSVIRSEVRKLVILR
jgi:hypothetical protein